MSDEEGGTPPDSQPRWNRFLSSFDWANISVAALSVVAIAASVALVKVTPEGTTEAGFALLILGSVLAGAWIATNRERD